MTQPSRQVSVKYEVPTARPDWLIAEEPVPESRPHDLVLDLLKAILVAFVARTRMNAIVARNLAVRFSREAPRVGMDPDLCIASPRPPEGDELTSLRLWEEGHLPPRLAVEVVSTSNPHKDYAAAPDKCAACGCKELWIFDPALAGPKHLGGPHRLQVWREDADGAFVRVHAGEGPAFSPTLGAWLHVVDEGRKLRIADDREATVFWMTGEEAERTAKEQERAAKERERSAKEQERSAKEQERAAKEQERAAKEQERAAKEAALARVAALEEALRRRGP